MNIIYAIGTNGCCGNRSPISITTSIFTSITYFTSIFTTFIHSSTINGEPIRKILIVREKQNITSPVTPIGSWIYKIWMQALAGEERTMIFYESPYRVVRCLEQFAEVFGEDHRVSVSREITKKFEQTVRGTVAEVLGHFRTTEPKGEFVIVVAGKPKVRRVREDGEE